MTADDASLTADALRALAPRAAAVWHIEVCDSTCSTSSDLLERRDAGNCVRFALEQTAGRGRRGRDWIARPRDSLTFSLRVRFAGPVDRLSGLSLAVGVILADALAGAGFAGLALKWPNDLMQRSGPAGSQEGGKLGGVLIELASAATHTDAVIGIGVNLAPPPVVCALTPASLFEATPPRSEWLRVAAALLEALAVGLPVFSQQGFAAFAGRWNQINLHAGCHVEVIGELSRTAGVCVGADVDGALMLDGGDRIERILAGDVSLRQRGPD